jgi:hypothetical protein
MGAANGSRHSTGRSAQGGQSQVGQQGARRPGGTGRRLPTEARTRRRHSRRNCKHTARADINDRGRRGGRPEREESAPHRFWDSGGMWGQFVGTRAHKSPRSMRRTPCGSNREPARWLGSAPEGAAQSGRAMGACAPRRSACRGSATALTHGMFGRVRHARRAIAVGGARQPSEDLGWQGSGRQRSVYWAASVWEGPGSRRGPLEMG